VLSLPPGHDGYAADLQLTRSYALNIAHYAFWRHPPGVLRWLAAGAVASLALWDMRNYGWLLMSMGRQLFFNNQLDAATGWFARARAIFDERDLLAELIYVHTDIATTLRILDKPQQALEHFKAVFEAIAEVGDPSSLATAYMNLGSAYYSLNNYREALHHHRRALRVAMRRNNSHAIASAHNNMGLVMEGMERWHEAEEAYTSALREFRRMNDETGVSACYNNLGSVNFASGAFQRALKWYELDLKLSEKNGNWTDMAATLHNLGHVSLEQGDLHRAASYFAQSRDLYAAFQLTEYVQEEQEMLEYILAQDPNALTAENSAVEQK
jgi:tetratricopeptide (TPR) repeat protein